MAAAYTGEDSIEDNIKSIFHEQIMKEEPLRYKLTFRIDEKIYETIFSFSDAGVTNNCIELTYWGELLQSSLKSNSPSKKCFTPILEKVTLPVGITQTDILQVLSTKLKFAIMDAPRLSISDIARLPNPVTNSLIITPFSMWRLLRGEDTLYEKYGYTHPLLSPARETIKSLKWTTIRDSPVFQDATPPPGQTLQQLVDSVFPGLFDDNMSIAENMKKIPYIETDKLIVKHPSPSKREKIYRESPPFGMKYTLPYLIMESLYIGGYIPFLRIPELTVERTSEIWKKWNSRLQFISFERVMAGGRRRLLNMVNVGNRRNRASSAGCRCRIHHCSRCRINQHLLTIPPCYDNATPRKPSFLMRKKTQSSSNRRRWRTTYTQLRKEVREVALFTTGFQGAQPRPPNPATHYSFP